MDGKDAFIKKIEKEALKKYWENKKVAKASNFLVLLKNDKEDHLKEHLE